jgi:hypothetical protein
MPQVLDDKAYLAFGVPAECVYCGTKTNIYIVATGEHICSLACLHLKTEETDIKREKRNEASKD